jgi:PAS domain S-box-containing protein
MINECQRLNLPCLTMENNVVIEVNSFFIELTDYLEHEVLGKDISEVLNMLRITGKLNHDELRVCTDGFIFTKSLDYRNVEIKIQRLSESRTVYIFSEKENSRFNQSFKYLCSLYEQDVLSVAIYSAPDLILLKASQSFLSIFGNSSSSFENTFGNKVCNLASEKEHMWFKTICEDLIITGEAITIKEYRHAVAEKDDTYWNLIITPIYEDSRVKYIVVTASDVTEKVLNRLNIGEKSKLIEQQNKRLEEIGKNENQMMRTRSLAKVIVAQLDLEGNIIDLTPQYCKMIGYSQEELMGKNFISFTHQDDISINWDCFNRLVNKQLETYEIEKRYVRKNGEVIWCYVNAALVTDDFGNPVGVLAYIQDTTQRKMLEEELKSSYNELRISQERFEKALEISKIMICTSTTDLNLLRVQPQFCDLIGSTESEILLTNFKDLIHPEDRAKSYNLYQDLLFGKLKSLELETRLVKKDGKIIWVYINCTIARDEKGRPLHDIIFIKNITERKTMEYEIIESYNRYKSLIEFLPEAVLVTHRGKYVLQNYAAAKLFGFDDINEMTGLDTSKFTHPRYKENSAKNFDLLYNQKKPVPFEEQKIIKNDGTSVDVEVAAMPIIYEGKESALCILRDVSQVKKDAAKLKQINKQLESYIEENENLMDELRRFRHNALNMLYSANGFLEDNDFEGFKKYFNNIKHQMKIMLDDSKFSIEKIKSPSLRGLLTAKLKHCAGFEIKMEVHADKDIKIENCHIRNTDLCEVLGIYLDNAIEAANEASNKKVNVYLSDSDKCITVIIENTFKEKPNLTLIDKGVSSKGHGRGLGLRISKKILSKYPYILNNTFLNHHLFVQEMHILKQT